MEGSMKVAVMEGIGKMGYTRRPIPKPTANEVLVKLEYVGICGSDMHYYETGAIGDYVVKPPSFWDTSLAAWLWRLART